MEFLFHLFFFLTISIWTLWTATFENRIRTFVVLRQALLKEPRSAYQLFCNSEGFSKKPFWTLKIEKKAETRTGREFTSICGPSPGPIQPRFYKLSVRNGENNIFKGLIYELTIFR